MKIRLFNLFVLTLALTLSFQCVFATTAKIPVVISSSGNLPDPMDPETPTEPTDPNDPGGGTDPTDPGELPPTDPNGFSVSIPMALPISVDSKGIVSTAGNAKITNYSGDAIAVDAVLLKSSGSWIIEEYGKSHVYTPVGTQTLGFKINDDETQEDGSFTISNSLWNEILDGEDNALALDYHASLPIQENATDNLTIMSVTFIVDWAE